MKVQFPEEMVPTVDVHGITKFWPLTVTLPSAVDTRGIMLLIVFRYDTR